MISLSSLFSSIKLGSLELKNRIIMPAMGTQFATEDGFITDQQIRYYVERAKGGVGLIVTEHVGISLDGKASPKMMMLSGEEYLPGFHKLVTLVHEAGAKIAIQLNHAGSRSRVDNPNYPLIAPSAIASPGSNRIPRPISTHELPILAQKWAEAADRARRSGADAIEIHMAHGYLLCQFLSPLSNQRTDSYGGSWEKRMKFPLEIYRAVRQAVGHKFPVWCRLSASEFIPGGLELESTKKIARALGKEGVDALHISVATPGSLHMMQPPYYVKDGPYVYMAEAIKSVVNIPVITVGKIKDPIMADRIIQDKSADLVAMGRALIADPYLPKKAIDGDFEDINPCISCNRCWNSIREGSLKCSVNPRVGKENDIYAKSTDKPKKILVIGGGVAGLKAAQMTAECGHHVTLVEKQHILGGQLNRAMVPPGKATLESLVDYLERQVKKSGVKIQLGLEVDAKNVKKWNPEIVLIATGARPLIPSFPGKEKVKLLTFEDVLKPDPTIGRKVLVLGGGEVGAEIADYLASKGKEVTIVEMLDEIAHDSLIHIKHYLMERLSNQKVKFFTKTKVIAFDTNSVIVENSTGRIKMDGYDSIVIAMGLVSSETLASKLKAKVEKIFIIGDAFSPRKIMEAIDEGYTICSKIES